MKIKRTSLFENVRDGKYCSLFQNLYNFELVLHNMGRTEQVFCKGHSIKIKGYRMNANDK